MKFHYQARTKTGEIQRGTVEAASQEAAINLLKSYQLFVTTLKEVAVPIYARKIKLLKKISRKNVVALSRQLAIMFKSEIPVIDVLQTLVRQTEHPELKEKLIGMIDKVEGGTSLSKTFSLYPEIFSTFYVNMVKAGEASGKLSDVFEYLADYMEREYNFNSRVKGALIYPAFLTAVFLLVGGAMVVIVLPQLSRVLSETGTQLPLITKILLGSGDFIRAKLWLILLILAALIISIYFYVKSKEGKEFFDKNLLKIPLLKNLLKKIYLARFALNLSTLISGGLPIVQALQITGETVGNGVYKSIILEVAEGVKKGEQMSNLLQRYFKVIPPMFVQMVGIGEKTGRIDSALGNIVNFYQKEVDRSLENFMRLLEPIIIIIFAVLVGGLMIAVVTPLYKIVSSF